MEGHSSISADVLASYAADAARDVEGVRGFAGRKAIRVSEDGSRVVVELHVAVDWGRSIPDVAAAVQARVGEYLTRMADVESPRVDVVVDEIG
jgi:uncharacterized alkaline shock family protein YloU